MKIPLPGKSAACSAPTGSNAAQNTGVVKDLEACKKRTMLSYQALNLLVQIRFPVLSLQASHLLQQAQLVCGITFTSNGFATAIQLVRGLAPLIPRYKRKESDYENKKSPCCFLSE